MVTSILGRGCISDDAIQIYFHIINDNVCGKYNISIINPVIAQAAKCLTHLECVIGPLHLQHKQNAFSYL